jgi:hypothetical protein
MPRYIQSPSADRRKATRDGYYTRNVFTWTDPFPEVHGTVPEKMVYAELTRMGIPFLFLNDQTFTIPEIDFSKEYQADFIIPSLRIIIEVQGAYWHSKPETLEADAFKLAVYESTGYKPFAWWDYDIIDDVRALFFSVPELVAAMRPQGISRSAELPVQSRKKQDTSKGIRTLNARRFRQKELTTGRRNVRKATGFYAT